MKHNNDNHSEELVLIKSGATSWRIHGQGRTPLLREGLPEGVRSQVHLLQEVHLWQSPSGETGFVKKGIHCQIMRFDSFDGLFQAGDNNHFHPTCARCTKCGEPFGDGEEMFLQGAAIWHPRCGPGPTAASAEDSTHYFINGFDTSADRKEQLISKPTRTKAAVKPSLCHNRSSVVSGHHQGHATPHYYGSSQHFHLPPSRLASSSRASSPGASLRRGDNSYYDSGRFSRYNMWKVQFLNFSPCIYLNFLSQ